jgi:hypothetical protein
VVIEAIFTAGRAELEKYKPTDKWYLVGCSEKTDCESPVPGFVYVAARFHNGLSRTTERPVEPREAVVLFLINLDTVEIREVRAFEVSRQDLKGR